MESKVSRENEVAFKMDLVTMPKQLNEWLGKGETSQELVDWVLDRIAAIQTETEADLAQYPTTSHRGIYGIGHKMLLATWTTFENQTRAWRREQAGLSNEHESSTQSSKTSSSKKTSKFSEDYHKSQPSSRSRSPERDTPPKPVKLMKQGGFYITGANTAMKPPVNAKERKPSDRSPPTAEAEPPSRPGASGSASYTSRRSSHSSGAISRASDQPYIPPRQAEAPYIPSRANQAPVYTSKRTQPLQPPPPHGSYAAPPPAPPPRQASSRWEFPPNPLPKPPQPQNIPPLRTDWATRHPPGNGRDDPNFPRGASGHPPIQPGHSTYSIYGRGNGYPSR